MGHHHAIQEGNAGMGDAADIMSPFFIYICSVCEMPTESEPCREHQPEGWKRWNG